MTDSTEEPQISERMQALVDDLINHAAYAAATHLGALVGRNHLKASTGEDAKRALLQEIAALQGASALEVPVVNDLVAWLDGPDGNGRADDAIIKFTDAKGAAIAHVNAEWMKVFLATTHGVDFSEGAAHKVPEYKSPSPSA